MTSTEERYLSATHSSNMRVEAEKHGDADVIIAAGWSPSRIGMALLRLHTSVTTGGLADVHEQLSIYAAKAHISNPDGVSVAVLAWWLNNVCTVCNGQQRQVIKDTPILSDVVCPACYGTGLKSLPCGNDGRKLANYIDDCLYSARRSLRSRLHPHKPPELIS